MRAKLSLKLIFRNFDNNPDSSKMTGMSNEIMKGNSIYNIGTPAFAKHVVGDKATTVKISTNKILGLAT